MDWYIWGLEIWLAIMLLLAITGLFSFESLSGYILNANEVVGVGAAMALLLIMNNLFFGITSTLAIMVLTTLVCITFLISICADLFKSPEDVEENNKKVGEAVVDSIKASREGGAGYLEAGITGAMAAEDEKRWQLAEVGVSMFMLLPNFIAACIGINSLL